MQPMEFKCPYCETNFHLGEWSPVRLHTCDEHKKIVLFNLIDCTGYEAVAIDASGVR
jgi:hypothetical protein